MGSSSRPAFGGDDGPPGGLTGARPIRTGSLPKCLTSGKGIQSRQRSPSAFAAVDTFITRRRSRFLTGMKW